MIKLPSHKDSFACEASPLFKEYLGLLGESLGAPAPIGEITSTDALLVIDMQRDFVPKSAANADGGRFGVAEGDHIAPGCEQLIKHFAKCGGHVIATRDYHPCDHISFMPQGGPFPAHCVQGTPGSYFLPSIASALAAGKSAGARVDVAFKGMHEDIDSFGALPYWDGGDNRLQKAMTLQKEMALGCCMGCEQAPWTGSLVMKMSAVIAASDAGSDQKLDMDAPPDCFAALADHKARGLMSLQHALKGCKRIFVCGLALDFCVLDTCLNAANADSGLKGSVYMVLDAARAAHIPGLGQFGSGFLSDPSVVLSKMDNASVLRTSVEAITGESPYGFLQQKPAFPRALGPLMLASPKLELSLTKDSYKVSGGLGIHSFFTSISSIEGQLSPRAALPASWAGAKEVGATRLAWAYPLEGIAGKGNSFLAISTSPALAFMAYGGFLLLDDKDAVLAVQAIAPELPSGDDAAVSFSAPKKWDTRFTAQLTDAKRFQPITLPFMLDAGARQFCWINPAERFSLEDGEMWTPSGEGAFLYLMADGDSFFFPVEPRTNKAPRKTGVRV